MNELLCYIVRSCKHTNRALPQIYKFEKAQVRFNTVVLMYLIWDYVSHVALNHTISSLKENVRQLESLTDTEDHKK